MRQTKLLELKISTQQTCVAVEPAKNLAQELGDTITKALSTSKKQKHDLHVDLHDKLSKFEVCGLGHDLWPRSVAVDHLANEKANCMDRGIAKPFVFTEIKHFFPMWLLEKPSDSSMLHMNLWSPSFLRYALAAHAVDMVSLRVVLLHYTFSLILSGAIRLVYAIPRFMSAVG